MAPDTLNVVAPQSVSALRPDAPPDRSPVAAEDAARAGVYGLLAALLRDAPSVHLLDGIAALDPAIGRDAFALAWEGLRLAARQVTAEEADDEYHRLFIGLGRGELVPYGSWYQTGFLMERPLGALRGDLAALGFEREPGVYEPEDHVAALCEVMAQLALDPAVPMEHQRTFYRAHLGPWIRRFCADLDATPAAPFYAAVGRLSAAFFDLEARYLEMQG